jgi:Uncharacterized protein conserved in bacteria (DUF2130)
MEASEKQLDLTPSTQADGTVRVLEDRLVIEAMTVTDERAARVVRERAEGGRPPVDTLAKAIEVGTRIIDDQATAANVDYVRRELQSGLGELSKELEETLEGGSHQLAEQIAVAFGADRSGSVQQQIRDIVAKASEQQKLEITRMLAAEDKSNPLVAVQSRLGKALLESEERHRQEMQRLRESHAGESRAMQRQVADLKENVARLIDQRAHEEELAESEEAGTRKGRSFEERVHDALETIAGTRGDCATHTGGEQAEGGGKKGDTLVELGAADGPAQGRIVFEAKDKKLTKNEAWRELNEAMTRRAANFAVLVVAGEERLPAGREQLREYEGNKLIVAVDREEPSCVALELAYRLAAARVTLARESDLGVDAAAVRDTAAEAISILKQAQAIKSTLTGIKTSSDKARSNLDALVESLRARLERIDSLVSVEPDQ